LMPSLKQGKAHGDGVHGHGRRILLGLHAVHLQTLGSSSWQLQLARQPRGPHLTDGDIEGAVSATVDVRYTLSSSTSSSKFSAK
jgi:hypothetical protein